MVVDTYVDGVGTVRECIDCGALIAGGPTRCIRCANECDITGIRRWILTKILGRWLPDIDYEAIASKKRAHKIMRKAKRRTTGGKR